MIKLLRAHGGCLATEGEEDVVSCEKLREPQTGVDPKISEWGTHCAESQYSERIIGFGSELREVNHLEYLKKRKQFSDFASAASEREQPKPMGSRIHRGCRTCPFRAGELQTDPLIEIVWKDGP